MELIKIIKHQEPSSIIEKGDILYPFEGWKNTNVGAGWYAKIPEQFYNSTYYILTAVNQNPWEALQRLKVNYFDFKDEVKYTCPYTNYDHYWCVPILVFTEDVGFWLRRYTVKQEGIYLDNERMKKFFPCKTKHGLPFTKIQRSLLGSGYSEKAKVGDGNGQVHDTIVPLENGDFLGCKVWIWFNKR